MNVFRKLVQGNVLTEDDFWKSRMASVDAWKQRNEERQKIGLPSSLLPDMTEAQDPSKTYQLTPERKRQILEEKLNVKEAYERHVPADMDEQEFWTKFCIHQSAIHVFFFEWNDIHISVRKNERNGLKAISKGLWKSTTNTLICSTFMKNKKKDSKKQACLQRSI